MRLASVRFREAIAAPGKSQSDMRYQLDESQGFAMRLVPQGSGWVAAEKDGVELCYPLVAVQHFVVAQDRCEAEGCSAPVADGRRYCSRQCAGRARGAANGGVSDAVD